MRPIPATATTRRKAIGDRDEWRPAGAEAERIAAAGGRLSIDRSALRANWRALAGHAHGAETAAVVKADAYGLGIATVVPALVKEGCRTFFVALASEGEAVRRHAPDARIYVLNSYFPGSAPLYNRHRLIPVIGSLDSLTAWRTESGGPYALQVETGMNRLGVTPEDALALLASGGPMAPVMVMSHLACGDTPAHPMNHEQLQRFLPIAAASGSAQRSLANSAGIMLGADYHFDLTRPGIALYGGAPGGDAAPPLRPVVTLEARIVALHSVRAGETISYGAAGRLSRDSRIATCSVGYGDGYPRALSGQGVPLRDLIADGAVGWLRGRFVPLVGRVTMDLTMFDVTDCGDGVATGDFIELVGAHVGLDALARRAGTIGYELLTGLGRRYQRRLVGRDVA